LNADWIAATLGETHPNANGSQTVMTRKLIANLLQADELALIAQTWSKIVFVDGKSTAGKKAARVKANEQASRDDPSAKALKGLVTDALRQNSDFMQLTRAGRVSPLILSRYTAGMEYGRHIDDAVMYPGGQEFRIDFSFTVFLSAPDTYDGGELILEDETGGTAIKADAGTVFVYPSGVPHRVARITKGERRAAVGWVESAKPRSLSAWRQAFKR